MRRSASRKRMFARKKTPGFPAFFILRCAKSHSLADPYASRYDRQRYKG